MHSSAPRLEMGPPHGATPGLGLLWRMARTCWIAITLFSTFTGLVWRFTGAAPELVLVLDGIGLVLSLCAWPLLKTLGEVRTRQERHGGKPSWRWRCRAVTVLHLWMVAACLALAPVGLLLGYNAKDVLLLLQTLDPYTIRLTTFLVGVGVMAIAGPVVVLLSTVILEALRRWCGHWAGNLLWVVIILVSHLPLLAGPDAGLVSHSALRLDLLGVPFSLELTRIASISASPIGLGLGQYTADVLTFFQQNTLEAGRYAYLENLIRTAVFWPIAGWFVVMIGWLGLSAMPTRRSIPRFAAAWPTTVSLISVALMQVALNAQWQAQPELRFPTQPNMVFTVGLSALWLGYALSFVFNRERPRLGIVEIAWTILASAGWLALTLPQLAAGQASLVELAILAGVAAALGLAGLAVLARLALLVPGQFGGWLAIAGVLALTLPLAPSGPLSSQLLRLLSTGWANPELLQPLVLLVTCCIGVALASWPWPVLRQIRQGAARIR